MSDSEEISRLQGQFERALRVKLGESVHANGVRTKEFDACSALRVKMGKGVHGCGPHGLTNTRRGLPARYH